MPIIPITIRNKNAVCTENIPYVCSNSDYEVVFTFDAEWEGYPEKTVRFSVGGQYIDRLMENDRCMVPVFEDGLLMQVGVYAGDLCTSTPAVIRMCDSIRSGSGAPADPTPSVYDSIMEKLNRILAGGIAAATAADWAVNDPADMAHVKNRTHWAEPKRTVILPETSPVLVDDDGDGTGDTLAIEGTVLTLEEGETYTVCWNGVEYTCTALNAANGILGLTDSNSLETIGSVFVIASFPDEARINVAAVDGSTEVVLSIAHESEDVHYLDPKYIKDMYYSVEDEILPDTTVEITDGGAYLTFPIALKADNHYTVTFNGEEYETVGYPFEEDGIQGVIIGDVYTLSNGAMGTEGSGEPFILLIFPEEMDGVYGMLMPLEEGLASVTFSIRGEVDLKRIKYKYLPSDLAKKSDLSAFDNGKMDAENPVGSGSFSMNRREGSVVGEFSSTEGSNNTASASYTHAEGHTTYAKADAAHSEGFMTTAAGVAAHAEGYYTSAIGNYSHAQGKYNIGDVYNKFAHIVGNGKAHLSRSNAHTLDWEGNAWFSGDVYVGSTSGTEMDDGSRKLVANGDTEFILASSTEGSTKRFRITVDDNGAISATEITE